MSRIAVVPTWQQATPPAIKDRVAVVIDVLRWSTVVATALQNGAERVEAFAEPGDATARAAQLSRAQTILGGERNNRPLPGFDLGNSPLEYSADRVGGRIVLTSTTNGTSALAVADQAALTFIAAFVNLSATVAALTHELQQGRALTLIAAGQAGAETLEDTTCAGAIVDALVASRIVTAPDLEMSAQRAHDAWRTLDRDVTKVMLSSKHAHALRADGFEGDVLFAGRVDAIPCVAMRHQNSAGRHTESPRSIVMRRT